MYKCKQFHTDLHAAGGCTGLSYFDPAIPLRPVDRASVDEGMDHFIPTAFATAARELLTLPLHGRMHNDSTVTPVYASHALVEVGFVQAPGRGTALPCVNWAGQPLAGVNITLVEPVAYKTATLSSGGAVVVSLDRKVLTFDLKLTADTLVLR